MNLGYFVSPCCRSILVVLNYDLWTHEVKKAGFDPVPRLTRSATTDEIIYFLQNPCQFPHWRYDDFNELIDEEITSGMPRQHLEAVLSLTMSVMDRATQPGHGIGHPYGIAFNLVKS